MDKNEASNDKAELASLRETVQTLTAEIARLQQKLERMRTVFEPNAARFGQSSEKQEYVMRGGQQLGLFNEAKWNRTTRLPNPQKRRSLWQPIPKA